MEIKRPEFKVFVVDKGRTDTVCSLIGHVMRALDRLAKKVLSELRVERPAPFVTIQACAKEMAYDQDFAKETGRCV